MSGISAAVKVSSAPLDPSLGRCFAQAVPLIKRPPEIAVLAPGVTLPGERLPLCVELTASKEVPIKGVNVSLHGLDIYYLRENSYSSFPFEILRQQQRVCGARVLAPGTTRLDCSFHLPGDVPPSFHGVKALAHYLVSVYVDIPWWPGSRIEYEVNVGWPPRPDMPARQRAYASAPGYFHGAQVEVTLAREVATTGEELDVAVALIGLPPGQPLSGVRVSLVAQESGPLNHADYIRSDTAYVFHCLEVPVDTLAAGGQVPLSVSVPSRIPPSFCSNRWALSWVLRLESIVTWGPAAVFDVPLTLLPPAHTGGARSRQMVRLKTGRPRRAVPTVVTEGGQAVWRHAASSSGFFFDGQTLHGRVGGVAVTITSELSREQACLLCKLDFASLELDLQVRPARGLEQLGGGLSIGVAPWDERFRVIGRDAIQVTTLLRSTGAGAPQLYELLLRPSRVEMDDDQLRLQWNGTGQDEAQLVQALEHARSVAAALTQARQQIPAPGPMAEMVPAWRALADRLHGTLETTNMAIRGSLHGHPFEVRTEWSSGEPLRTVLLLRSPAGPEPVHQLELELRGHEEASPSALEALPEAARAMAGGLASAVRLFKLSPGMVRVDLDAPLADPAPAQDRLGQMMRLLATLTSREGPYR